MVLYKISKCIIHFYKLYLHFTELLTKDETSETTVYIFVHVTSYILVLHYFDLFLSTLRIEIYIIISTSRNLPTLSMMILKIRELNHFNKI